VGYNQGVSISFQIMARMFRRLRPMVFLALLLDPLSATTGRADGGPTSATATLIAANPYTDSGNTTGKGNNALLGICASGGSDTAEDGWYRDASAASIMASTLYELSTYSKTENKYKETADKILDNLFTHYTSPVGENKGFILLHSTGSKPSDSEVDVPLAYADYYFLEALLRKKALNEN
jgi:hypothetical protein